MANLNNEKDFIDGLIEEGVVKDLTLDKVEKENELRKNKFNGIKPPKSLIVEAPGDEIIDAPMDDSPLGEPSSMGEPEVPVDDLPAAEPDSLDAPVEEIGDPIIDAMKALFLTSIIKAGANFKEYKSEAMKDALYKQGVGEDLYNAIGKALYELDTTSEMFN